MLQNAMYQKFQNLNCFRLVEGTHLPILYWVLQSPKFDRLAIVDQRRQIFRPENRRSGLKCGI